MLLSAIPSDCMGRHQYATSTIYAHNGCLIVKLPQNLAEIAHIDQRLSSGAHMACLLELALERLSAVTRRGKVAKLLLRFLAQHCFLPLHLTDGMAQAMFHEPSTL